MSMDDLATELNAIRDDLWKAKIRLAISESKDGYGVVNPEQLVKYLEMAMEGSK